MSNVAASSLVGSTLGDKYVIEELIGQGATGKVYRARQTSLQRTVAIKVLHGQLAEQPSFVQRFEREALSTSRLDHPNSLRVLDFGRSAELFYLVMEFAQGEDLLTVMAREWPLETRRVVDIISQALAALATAHDMQIVHRDLKPENILLMRGTDDDGRPADVVKVCDFGIAKIINSTSENDPSFARRLTTEGFVIGTPDFMSPEQARGQELDGRSDLYSIGVVLYQLLTGQLPFNAETPLGVALQHISDPPPPPSSRSPKVDPRLEAICLRALSKDPRDRFQNAREMRRALRALVELEPDRTSSLLTPRSTDMTSVPEISDESAKLGRGTSRFGRLLRRPATRRDWALAFVAAVAGFAGLTFLVRGVSKHEMDDRPAVATANETVLANPLPEPTFANPAPLNTPALTAEEIDRRARSRERSDDRERSRPEKTSGHSSAPQAAAGAGDNASPSLGRQATPAAAQPGSPSGEVSAGSAETTAKGLSERSDATAIAAQAPRPAPAAQTVGALPAGGEPVAPAAAPPIDPSRASVTVGAITTTGGISGSKVRAAIARVPFTSCYQKSLVNRSAAEAMDASLRINLDMAGHVSMATLSNDGKLPGLRACIESQVRSVSIRDVDTGDGSAVITLTFSPR
jgi:serine/threonine-protein kinase